MKYWRKCAETDVACIYIAGKLELALQKSLILDVKMLTHPIAQKLLPQVYILEKQLYLKCRLMDNNAYIITVLQPKTDNNTNVHQQKNE